MRHFAGQVTGGEGSEGAPGPKWQINRIYKQGTRMAIIIPYFLCMDTTASVFSNIFNLREHSQDFQFHMSTALTIKCSEVQRKYDLERD